MNEDEVVCSSCDQPKAQLFAQKSKLVANATLFMCQSCLDKGYEPRWAIILAGRTMGVGAIRPYIVNNLYLGDQIKAKEVIS